MGPLDKKWKLATKLQLMYSTYRYKHPRLWFPLEMFTDFNKKKARYAGTMYVTILGPDKKISPFGELRVQQTAPDCSALSEGDVVTQ